MICMYIYYIHLSTLANRKWTQMNSSWRAQRIHPMEATPQDQLRAAFYRPGLLTGQGQDPHSPISAGSCAHHRYTHGQLYLSRHGPSAQWDVGEEVIWRCLNYRTMTQFNTIPWHWHITSCWNQYYLALSLLPRLLNRFFWGSQMPAVLKDCLLMWSAFISQQDDLKVVPGPWYHHPIRPEAKDCGTTGLNLGIRTFCIFSLALLNFVAELSTVCVLVNDHRWNQLKFLGANPLH